MITRTLQISLFAVFYLTAPLAAFGQTDCTPLVVRASGEYENGKFAEAAKFYGQAIEAGCDNGHAHYNLANSYYRMDELGLAIAHYRRALALLPGDPDVLANLNLARGKVSDRFDSAAGVWTQLQRVLFLRGWLTQHQTELIFLGVYTLFWFGFALEPLFSSRFLKSFTVGILAVLLYFSVLAFATRLDRFGQPSLALTPEQRARGAAVIVPDEVKVYSGNSTQFQVISILHKGAELDSREVRGDWVEVILPQGRRGWVKAQDVYLLE